MSTLIYPEPPGGARGALPLQPSPPPEGTRVGNWTQFRAQKTYSAAVTLGFPSLFDLHGSANGVVVVDSIRRFAEVPADGGKDLWGTSVSLVVEAQGVDVKASTPLPAISARVELGEASATATLQVRGFDDKGFMAQFKSGPLTVETYMEYVTSLEKVRDYIAANEDGMYLAYLGRELDPDTSDAGRRAAVIESAVLRWATDGGSLSEFLRRRDKSLSEDDKETAHTTWTALTLGQDPNEAPSARAAAIAADAVAGFDR
ncbi:hypothetical protein [Leifsonia aquatica]|uniref:hypothetical protein n=1 Tax=Leifsonia aquatica TaxID=144185 RepID=UPI0038027367